jgi:hypothetical protein
MPTFVAISIIASGPFLGALSAIALGYNLTWQVLIGALIGQAIAVGVGRVASEVAAARTMRRALDAARSGRSASVVIGSGSARPDNVVIRATGLTWRHHATTVAVFTAFALLAGWLVAILRGIVVAGRA